MNGIIEIITSLFKSKNVDLSVDDLKPLADAVNSLNPKPDAPPTPLPITGDNNEIRALIAGLQKTVNDAKLENESYKTMNSDLMKALADQKKLLEEEKANRETILEGQKQQQQRDFASKVEAKLAKAKEERRFPAENKELEEQYRQMLMTNWDVGEKIIDALPKPDDKTAAPRDTTPISQPRSFLADVAKQGIIDKIKSQEKALSN